MDDYRRDPLWLRLAFLERETAGRQLSLSRLVADTLGCDASMARRLVEEYRRFLFLLMRAGHAVTPPPAIERVLKMHEHHALNFWEALSAMVTERPMVGGGTNVAESYERIFGSPPPADIWIAQDDSVTLPERVRRVVGQFASVLLGR